MTILITSNKLIDALATRILAAGTTAQEGPNQRLYSAMVQEGYFGGAGGDGVTPSGSPSPSGTPNPTSTPNGKGRKLKYVEFKTSGTFTPPAGLIANGGECWVLLVGGGGGAGGGSSIGSSGAGQNIGYGGGGGGGGVKVLPMTITNTTTITIGAGGSGGIGYNSETSAPETARGGNGGDTSVGDVSVPGGGGAGSMTNVYISAGKPGACSGGAGGIGVPTTVEGKTIYSAGMGGGGGGMGGSPSAHTGYTSASIGFTGAGQWTVSNMIGGAGLNGFGRGGNAGLPETPPVAAAMNTGDGGHGGRWTMASSTDRDGIGEAGSAGGSGYVRIWWYE